MNRSKISIAISALITLVAFAIISAPAAQASNTHRSRSQSVDISSRTWVEDGKEVSAVCINGKEIISYRGQPGESSEKADDLTFKLQALLDSHKFDANQLLPGKSGSLAALQQDGNNVLSFETTNSSSSPKESSLKLVNALRVACGVPTVPKCILGLSDAVVAFRSVSSSRNVSSRFSGQASWYGPHFHGKRCSDGSRFDQEQMTAAHRSLPFGTKLLVINRATGKTCIVKINDRGPFIGDRVIDLSKGAARQLKMLSSGVAMVDCLVLGNN